GKGGVGKTTCAAAVALALADQPKPPRVLLLSTDPAHSLAGVLDADVGDKPTAVSGAPPSLRVREIDAAALFAARRRRYLETVDAVFEALRGGSRFDPTYDRVVVEDLIDLAPPGLDELLGILTVTEALGRGDRERGRGQRAHATRLRALPSRRGGGSAGRRRAPARCRVAGVARLRYHPCPGGRAAAARRRRARGVAARVGHRKAMSVV